MEPITLGLLLAGLAASSAAAVYTNKKNIEYASGANDTQIALANTAHQREVRDLRAAGLNPVLSASGSGAAVPQLKVPDLSNPLGDAASTARDLASAANGSLDAEIREAQASANSAESEAAMLDREQELSKYRTALETVEDQARLQALTGDEKNDNAVSMDTYPGNSDVHFTSAGKPKAYDDLVKMYRRQIEKGAYESSVYRAMYNDARAGVSSARDLVMTLNEARPKPKKAPTRRGVNAPTRRIK